MVNYLQNVNFNEGKILFINFDLRKFYKIESKMTHFDQNRSK